MRIHGLVPGVCALLFSALAQAQGCNEPGGGAWRVDPVAQGGRLYDNWWAACGLAKPQGTHPSYPAAGKQSGEATWRCKECHGWDYKGKDGAYAKGSHYTGIVGISAASGRDEGAIVAILKDGTHRFDTVLPPALLQRIARFVRDGQVDPAARIDAATQRVSANVAAGERLYSRECMVCHGGAGRALNFSGKTDAPEYVGTVAADNPWEALHKIRNGQPGSVMNEERVRALEADPDRAAWTGDSMHGGMGGHMRGPMAGHMVAGRAMPAMRGRLSLAEQLDLLSFLQTLPSR